MSRVRVVDDEKGTIDVGHGFGQSIWAKRADGEERTVIMIECREEYDYEMVETMKWLGLVDEHGRLVQ